MSTRPAGSVAPLQGLLEGCRATVIASMRVVADETACDRPLFRLLRIRLAVDGADEEHLVRVERRGSTCLTHGERCREAGLAAEAFLAAREASWEGSDVDDHQQLGA